MWAVRTDVGYLVCGLTRTWLETLRGVPMLLESNDPRVRKRLLPETYDDDDAEQQWRRHSAPELERLFMSRAQIVRKDLGAMRQLKDADSWVLFVPDTHQNAWLATLNAARLALFLLSDLEAEHLEREGHQRATDKQREAIARIHFLAELQSILMGQFDLMDDLDLDDDSGNGGGLKVDDLDLPPDGTDPEPPPKNGPNSGPKGGPKGGSKGGPKNGSKS